MFWSGCSPTRPCCRSTITRTIVSPQAYVRTCSSVASPSAKTLLQPLNSAARSPCLEVAAHVPTHPGVGGFLGVREELVQAVVGLAIHPDIVLRERRYRPGSAKEAGPANVRRSHGQARELRRPAARAALARVRRRRSREWPVLG